MGSWGYSLHGNSSNKIRLDFDLNVTNFINELQTNNSKFSVHFNNITHLHTDRLIAGKFRIGKELGHGSFGNVYLGYNIETGQRVAIKSELIKTKQLHMELALYQRIQGGFGFPQVQYYGTEDAHNVLILDLLGPAIDKILSYCGARFSLKTIILLATQMITRLEFVHSRGLINKDIKPNNMLMGLGDKKDVLHMIDFGLAQAYVDKNGQHYPMSTGLEFVGTYQYGSLHAHLGYKLSRRDDLESLGYTLIQFLLGTLPWQNIHGPSNEKSNSMYRMKAKLLQGPLFDLCPGHDGCPWEFKEYFRYVLSLNYDEQPDYDYLRSLFEDLFERHNFIDDGRYDWVIAKERREQNKTLDYHSKTKRKYVF